jgi:hypothetical protein
LTIRRKLAVRGEVMRGEVVREAMRGEVARLME